MSWAVAFVIVVLILCNLRGETREHQLVRALLIEMTRGGDPISWDSFRERTGLTKGYFGAFHIAAARLVQEGELVREHPPDRPTWDARYRRKPRVAELYPC